jgi:hypothetical protein
MKKSLTLFCLILSLSTFGQEVKKFKLGLSLNPSISNNIISNNGNTPKVVGSIFRSIEKPILAYEIGVFSEYDLNHKSKLRIGFGYSNAGYRTEKRKTLTAVPEPSLPEYTQFVWKHQDVVIPILYSKYLKNGLSKIYLIGGVEPQIKINRTVRFNEWFLNGSSNTNQNKDNSTEFRRINVNLVLGIGYDLKLSPKNRLFIQPTIDCNILGTSKNANLNRRIYCIGLTVGTLIK